MLKVDIYQLAQLHRDGRCVGQLSRIAASAYIARGTRQDVQQVFWKPHTQSPAHKAACSTGEQW